MRRFLVGQVLSRAIHNSSDHLCRVRHFPSLTLQFGLLLKHDTVQFVELTLLEGKSLLQDDQ